MESPIDVAIIGTGPAHRPRCRPVGARAVVVAPIVPTACHGPSLQDARMA